MTSTHTTAAGGNTAASAITEDFVSTAVKTQVTAIQEEATKAQAMMQHHMENLEKQLDNLSHTIDTIAAQLAKDVINKLSAPNGVLTLQENRLAAQAAATDKLMNMMVTLTANVKHLMTTPGFSNMHPNTKRADVIPHITKVFPLSPWRH